MRRAGLIALLTDFGGDDWFVGALKGAIVSIAPRARIIDVTHGIPRGDVRAGAFALWAAFRSFPKGTVFAAVVDPGVGGPRAPLMIEANGYRFVGPDNGLLSWAAAGDPRRRLRALENPAFRLRPVSRTFHGRDVFAPAAAHLALGVRPSAFGPLLAAMAEIPRSVPYKLPQGLGGEILHVDAFGNAITNFSAADLEALSRPASAASARKGIFPLKEFYAQVSAGKPLGLIGSCGLLELSVRDGSAAKRFGLKPGDGVRLR